jgi:hypothetical protein
MIQRIVAAALRMPFIVFSVAVLLILLEPGRVSRAGHRCLPESMSAARGGVDAATGMEL